VAQGGAVLKTLKNGAVLGLVSAPVLLLILGGLGVFGSNCQQTTVDVVNDLRSYHVIIHN